MHGLFPVRGPDRCLGSMAPARQQLYHPKPLAQTDRTHSSTMIIRIMSLKNENKNSRSNNNAEGKH